MASANAALIHSDSQVLHPRANSAALLRPLCDGSMHPTLLVDTSGAILHRNPAASSLLARLVAAGAPRGGQPGSLSGVFGVEAERELLAELVAAIADGVRRDVTLSRGGGASTRCTVLPLMERVAAVLLEPALLAARLAPDEGLARIAQSLLGAGADHSTVLRCLCDGVVELLLVEGAAVALVEGGSLRIVAAAGAIADTLEAVFPLGPWLTGQVVERGSGAYTNDALNDPRIAREYAERFGIRRLAIAPMLDRERVVGMLCAVNRPDSPFTRLDSALLARIAERGALAIENATLLARARREREQAEAAAEIAQVALAGDPASVAGEQLLAIIERIAPSAGKALAVLDPEEKTLRFVAALGISSVVRGVQLPIKLSVAQAAVHRAEPHFIPDLREASDPEMLHLTTANAVTVFPLVAKGRVIGVLSAASALGERLPEERMATIVRLAPAAALALDVMLLTEAEGRRRSRERLLAAALKSLEHPVFIVSTEGRIVYANSAAQAGYGFSGDEFPGMLLEKLGVAPPTPAEQGALYSALEECGLWRVHTVHRRKDSSCFPADVTWTLVRDEEGNQAGIVVAVRDLTEERRISEQRRQTEKMATLGELVAGVAHEINNPLTGISAFAQMLMDEPLGTEQLESVRMIKREADRAVGVIRDLLVFARKTHPRPRPLSLNDVVAQALRLRVYGFRTAGIEIISELAPDLPAIKGDEQKLQQVVLNLVVNAEQAMQLTEHRRLTVRSFARDGCVVLEVEDCGTGMDAEVLKHVFEPFFTTKPEGSGTGLGLSVSYGIVEAHQGRIEVHSTPGVGTTFRISFPHVQDEPIGLPASVS